MEDEFVKKLKEKYENGEISKETYEDILERYMKEATREKKENKTTAEYTDRTVNKEMKNESEKSEESGRDYKCAGSCTIPPGKYEYVSGAGSVKITGDIEAIKLSVSGSLHAEGNIKAETFKSAGSAKIDGNLNTEELSAAGVVHAKNLRGERIRIGGAAACDNIKGENVSIGGSVKAKKIEGEEVSIKLNGNSTINEIHGDTINIKSKSGILRRFLGSLNSGKISGEEIYIESTIADTVEGERVIVGDGCTINRVIAEDIKISKKSKVKEVVKK